MKNIMDLHRGRSGDPQVLIDTLAAIHKTGSITKAARRLGVTHQTISSRLRRLEDITGEKMHIAHWERSTVLTNAALLILRDYGQQ